MQFIRCSHLYKQSEIKGARVFDFKEKKNTFKLYTKAVYACSYLIVRVAAAAGLCVFVTRYCTTLTIAPLRLIDPSNPGVELAYERLHSATRGTQAVVAYITPAFSKIDDWAQFHGFRLSVNEKFYAAQLENHFYGGAGFVFNRIQYRKSGFYTTTDETAAKSDTIQLHRTTIAFNIFYGAQVPAGHFIYEFSSGIGLKYRIITQNKPGWPVNYARDMGAFSSLYTAGRTWTLNLPVTIRLGYRF